MILIVLARTEPKGSPEVIFAGKGRLAAQAAINDAPKKFKHFEFGQFQGHKARRKVAEVPAKPKAPKPQDQKPEEKTEVDETGGDPSL